LIRFITNPIRSGVSEGNIYKHIASHSEDFGENFITHSVNGIFGLIVDSEIDSNDGVGYCLTQNMIYTDTLYVFLTYDKYENLELVSSVNRFEQPLRYLSRGINTGELYTFIDFENSMLRFSNDFGNSWETKNNLYFNNYATVDFTGGRQAGEVYFLVTYLQLMGQIKHIFIYHSLDYGETFAVYHPFAYGPDPFYVAFEADSNTGLVPLAIQFIDESSGEDISWEWDFNNDGIIDSYEQNPIFTYPDTGYYDVNLTVTNQYNQYSLVKEDYIYVKDTTTLISSEIFQSINIYPNPVAEELAIEIPKNIFDVNLSIYSSVGEIKYKAEVSQNKTIIDISKYQPGIYFIHIKNQNNSITTKIIKI